MANLDLGYELYYQRYEKPEKVRPEPIVLAATMAHPVNADLRLANRAMIDEINGRRIESLDDVIEAFKDNAKNQHMIKFASGTVECLDKAGSDSANAEILSTYGIPVDRRL